MNIVILLCILLFRKHAELEISFIDVKKKESIKLKFCII